MPTASEVLAWASHLRELSSAWAHAEDVLRAAAQLAQVQQQYDTVVAQIEDGRAVVAKLAVDVQAAKAAMETSFREQHEAAKTAHEKSMKGYADEIMARKAELSAVKTNISRERAEVSERSEREKANYEAEILALTTRRDALRGELSSLVGRIGKL